MSTKIGSEVSALWTHAHHHHQTIMLSVCGGETFLIQQCPVAHQSYLPPPAFCLSKTVSLFSPHTSLPGNPIAFSWVFSFLTASPTAQTHSSPLDRERESRRRLVNQRQVPDIQPASQRNFSSATSCVAFPSTPLSLCGLLRASAAHLRYQDPQRRAKSPFSLRLLLLSFFYLFCTVRSSFFCHFHSPSPRYSFYALEHFPLLLLFLSFRPPFQPEFPQQAFPQAPQPAQSWHTVLSTPKHIFSFGQIFTDTFMRSYTDAHPLINAWAHWE